MARLDPVAYVWAADLFCPGCTRLEFGSDLATARDFEGNLIGAVPPWSEDFRGWCCSRCGEVIL